MIFNKLKRKQKASNIDVDKKDVDNNSNEKDIVKENDKEKYYCRIDEHIDCERLDNLFVERINSKDFEENVAFLLSRSHPYVARYILFNMGLLKNMGKFDDYPQLLLPVVTDQRKMCAAFGWLYSEMMKRYEMYSAVGVYSIEEYNEYVSNNPELDYMPYVLVIIDDFQNISVDLYNDFIDTFVKILDSGKATGIRIICGTSRDFRNIKISKDLEDIVSIISKMDFECICQGEIVNCDKSHIYSNGHEFEHLCAEILQLLGYEDVSVTKGSGDQGVDIIAKRDGVKYAIQCKYYNNPVGNKAIQEVYAGMQYYKAHIGIVMTNSVFTQSAKELANSLGIVLWDGSFLGKYL